MIEAKVEIKCPCGNLLIANPMFVGTDNTYIECVECGRKYFLIEINDSN